jgi:hypothetical protein
MGSGVVGRRGTVWAPVVTALLHASRRDKRRRADELSGRELLAAAAETVTRRAGKDTPKVAKPRNHTKRPRRDHQRTATFGAPGVPPAGHQLLFALAEESHLKGTVPSAMGCCEMGNSRKRATAGNGPEPGRRPIPSPLKSPELAYKRNLRYYKNPQVLPERVGLFFKRKKL